MKARKILAGMLAMSMVLSLAACGSSDTDTTAASSTTAAATEAGDEASAAEEGNATEAEGEETEANTDGTAEGELVDYETGLATVLADLNLNPEDFADLEPVTLTVTSSASSSNYGYNMMVGIAEAITEQTGGETA